jgi:leader peptidase (prepilin peptidase)/N-methyltransferase
MLMDAFLAIPRPVLAIAAGVLGSMIGSFLNVVIHRAPRGESIVTPGSHCPGGGRTLGAWENIPVLSYIALGGRCRGCGSAISLRCPAIEVLTAALFAAIVWIHGAQAMTVVWLAFGAALIAAAVIDFDHRIIPDAISVGGLLLALVAVPAIHIASGWPVAPALLESAVGALLGGGTLWLVGFVHARISVALGRRFSHWPGEGEEIPTIKSLDYWIWFPGVGFGDVKLLAMIGAVLGPQGVVETILVAAVAGLALGLLWALATRHWNAPFGFGPAIATGALLVLLLS